MPLRSSRVSLDTTETRGLDVASDLRLISKICVVPCATRLFEEALTPLHRCGCILVYAYAHVVWHIITSPHEGPHTTSSTACPRSTDHSFSFPLNSVTTRHNEPLKH